MKDKIKGQVTIQFLFWIMIFAIAAIVISAFIFYYITNDFSSPNSFTIFDIKLNNTYTIIYSNFNTSNIKSITIQPANSNSVVLIPNAFTHFKFNSGQYEIFFKQNSISELFNNTTPYPIEYVTIKYNNKNYAAVLKTSQASLIGSSQQALYATISLSTYSTTPNSSITATILTNIKSPSYYFYLNKQFLPNCTSSICTFSTASVSNNNIISAIVSNSTAGIELNSSFSTS